MVKVTLFFWFVVTQQRGWVPREVTPLGDITCWRGESNLLIKGDNTCSRKERQPMDWISSIRVKNGIFNWVTSKFSKMKLLIIITFEHASHWWHWRFCQSKQFRLRKVRTTIDILLLLCIWLLCWKSIIIELAKAKIEPPNLVEPSIHFGLIQSWKTHNSDSTYPTLKIWLQ